MTQDEIIRMAREAGLIQYVQVEKACVSNALERFAALVAAHEREKEIKRVAEGHGWTQAHWTAYEESIAAAEREACAQVCGQYAAAAFVDYPDDRSLSFAANECAAAIRARGEK